MIHIYIHKTIIMCMYKSHYIYIILCTTYTDECSDKYVYCIIRIHISMYIILYYIQCADEHVYHIIYSMYIYCITDEYVYQYDI